MLVLSQNKKEQGKRVKTVHLCVRRTKFNAVIFYFQEEHKWL